MKVMFLSLVFLLCSASLMAQQLPEWSRVYTFDESIIEMNTSPVIFGGKRFGSVRFRWTFDQPEALSGEPQLKYKSRLEVIEFDCSDKRFRPFEVTLLDEAGRIIRFEEMKPPGEWSKVAFGSMMEKLFAPACELIEQKTRTPAPVPSNDAIELEKVAKYAFSFSQRLEQAKDFKPIIEKFFAADYLNGYLHDSDSNWFLNLNRDTAAKASRAELQRFYVALLNSGYLSCLYLISQYPSTSDEPVPAQKLIPVDVVQLINNHPYTAAYKGKGKNYDYLAENIDSVERLRSYTDLLEKIGTLMRKHATSVKAEHSTEYQAMLEDWNGTFDLYRPEVRICVRACLGLPQGTRLFEVNVPVFHLQLAEIKGEMRIVSAMHYF